MSGQVTEITDSVAVSKKVPLVDLVCAKSTGVFPIQIEEVLKGKVEEDKRGWNGKQRKEGKRTCTKQVTEFYSFVRTLYWKYICVLVSVSFSM